MRRLPERRGSAATAPRPRRIAELESSADSGRPARRRGTKIISVTVRTRRLAGGQLLRAGRHVPEDAMRRELAAVVQRIERRQIDEQVLHAARGSARIASGVKYGVVASSQRRVRLLRRSAACARRALRRNSGEVRGCATRCISGESRDRAASPRSPCTAETARQRHRGKRESLAREVPDALGVRAVAVRRELITSQLHEPPVRVSSVKPSPE